MKTLTYAWFFGMLSVHEAFAGSAGMPWESPLKKVVDSFSGPVAYVVSILALVLLFIRYSYGGELNGFGRALITIIIGIAGLVGATGLLNTLFGVTKGAEFVLMF